MEKNLKEIGGYDDPTRQKLTQHEIAMGSSQAFSLLSAGVNKLQEMINFIQIEDELKIGLAQSTTSIMEELKKIQVLVNNFTDKNLKGQINPETGFASQWPNRGPVGMNETTQDKINNTINHIIEVNKKLNNHGTKSR